MTADAAEQLPPAARAGVPHRAPGARLRSFTLGNIGKDTPIEQAGGGSCSTPPPHHICFWSSFCQCSLAVVDSLEVVAAVAVARS